MKESNITTITGDVPVKETVTEATEALQEVETDDGAEGKSAPFLYPYPYYAEDNCLYAEFPTKNGVAVKRLCNFVPRILTERIVYDGRTRTRQLVIGGTNASGEELPAVEVAVSELEKMSWMQNNWDLVCDLCVVPQVEKHVRFAIKSTAPFAEKKTVFSQTGWQSVDGSLHFMLPGNGRYDVQLHGKQCNYQAADFCEDIDVAYLSGFLQLDFIPHEIMYPCLALVFLSPLNEFLRRVELEPKFIMTLIGRTGSMKSTVAALMLSFFGKFSATDLPMSFRDTPNSVIHNAFALKDVLTCVDDYHPTARNESDKMNAVMQILVRGFGDKAGRNRLTSDITLREAMPPMGNVIVTAEYAPEVGESGSARQFCIEMQPKQLDLKLLTEIQQKATEGMLMRIMFGYTEWIENMFLCSEEAEQAFLSSLRDSYFSLRESWRDRLNERKIVFHDRLPDTLTCLEIGFGMMLRFMKAYFRCNEESTRTTEYAEYEKRFIDIVLSHSEKQSAAVIEDKPTHIFISKLFSLIESKKYSVISRFTTDIVPPANLIGYEDDEFYYFNKTTAHRAVKKLCAEQGELFAVSERGLLKALAEEGFIETGKNQNTKNVRVGNDQFHVMYLYKDRAKEIIERYV